MRVELIPLILGVLAALVGLGLLADAWIPEDMTGFRERRRTARTERSLGGEAAIGIVAHDADAAPGCGPASSSGAPSRTCRATSST